jgi:hypothetical protein
MDLEVGEHEGRVTTRGPSAHFVRCSKTGASRSRHPAAAAERVQESVADGLAKIRAYRIAGWELNVRLRRLKTQKGDVVVALTNNEFNLATCSRQRWKQCADDR